MGQDISVTFKKANKTQSLSVEVEGGAKNSIINSANEFVNLMNELSESISWNYPYSKKWSRYSPNRQ